MCIRRSFSVCIQWQKFQKKIFFCSSFKIYLAFLEYGNPCGFFIHFVLLYCFPRFLSIYVHRKNLRKYVLYVSLGPITWKTSEYLINFDLNFNRRFQRSPPKKFDYIFIFLNDLFSEIVVHSTSWFPQLKHFGFS